MDDVLIYIAHGSTLGRDAVWSTFVEKIDFFKREFKSSFMIGRLMKSVISLFTDSAKIDEIEKFCQNNPIDSAKRAVEQGRRDFSGFKIPRVVREPGFGLRLLENLFYQIPAPGQL